MQSSVLLETFSDHRFGCSSGGAWDGKDTVASLTIACVRFSRGGESGYHHLGFGMVDSYLVPDIVEDTVCMFNCHYHGDDLAVAWVNLGTGVTTVRRISGPTPFFMWQGIIYVYITPGPTAPGPEPKLRCAHIWSRLMRIRHCWQACRSRWSKPAGML